MDRAGMPEIDPETESAIDLVPVAIFVLDDVRLGLPNQFPITAWDDWNTLRCTELSMVSYDACTDRAD